MELHFRRWFRARESLLVALGNFRGTFPGGFHVTLLAFGTFLDGSLGERRGGFGEACQFRLQLDDIREDGPRFVEVVLDASLKALFPEVVLSLQLRT